MDKEQRAFIKGFVAGTVYAIRVRMFWEALENISNQIENNEKKKSKIGSFDWINGHD